MISAETRLESYKAVDKKIRYEQILDILSGCEMTAKEIAVEMYRRKYIPTTERNFAAPRLTELCKKGLIMQADKKTCQYTGKAVTVYKRSDGRKASSLAQELKDSDISYTDIAAILSEELKRNINKSEISVVVSGKAKQTEKAIRRYLRFKALESSNE